jgi:hydrogenase expression/formation protein HypE
MHDFSLHCPVPISRDATIKLAHGGGGRLMQQLLQSVFFKHFAHDAFSPETDSAVLPFPAEKQLAFTTDSFVVRPLFFPGGNIGTLAVNGTVNDLAMAGAKPLWISAAFVLEEGTSFDVLDRVAASMREAADAAGVVIVTGDTKIVDKGKGDGVYITTSGVGVVDPGCVIHPSQINTGDVVVLSGDIGRHGMAVMSVREGLAFESDILSDCAPLTAPVDTLLQAGITPRMMRDCTRGGVASALIEIAAAARVHVRVQSSLIPVQPTVRAACELLGLDPLYVANEGCFICFLPKELAESGIRMLQKHDVTRNAVVIGEVIETQGDATVSIRNELGLDRVLDLLSGEQLPRIC